MIGRWAGWVRKNADGVIALVLAASVAVLSVIDVIGASSVNGAVLLILAVLAATLLRDRSRADAVEQAVKEVRTEVRDLTTRTGEVEIAIAGVRTTLSETSHLQALSGDEVRRAHDEARRNTEMWMFKGGAGTFLRAVTLPNCIQDARSQARPLSVRAQIIDPSNERVCEAYSVFRRSVSQKPDGTGEVWTPERVRRESYATILALCQHRQQYELLTAEVGLSDTMTTFRVDISSSAVIITQEDPRVPAILIRRGWVYYDRYKTELLTSLRQSRLLPIEAAVAAVPLSDEPTVEETRKLFEVLKLPLSAGSFDDRAVSAVIDKAVRPKNPYA